MYFIYDSINCPTTWGGSGGGGGGGQNTKLNVRLAIRQGADLFGVNISANKLALLDYSGSEL